MKSPRQIFELASSFLFCFLILLSARVNATQIPDTASQATAEESAVSGETSGYTGVISLHSQPVVRQSADEAPMVKLEDNKSKKRHLFGAGLDLGVHIFFPEEINGFLDSIWQIMIDDNTTGSSYVVNVKGTPSLFLGWALGGHVSIRPIPYLSISFIGKMVTAPKSLNIGSVDLSNPDVSVTARDRLIGWSFSGYLMPDKAVSLKGGFNIEYHWVSLEAKQVKTMTKSGEGFGFMPFAGLAIAPGKGRVLISIDLTVPICSIDLTEQKGTFGWDDSYFVGMGGMRLPFPDKVVFTGFEIKPAITICFP